MTVEALKDQIEGLKKTVEDQTAKIKKEAEEAISKLNGEFKDNAAYKAAIDEMLTKHNTSIEASNAQIAELKQFISEMESGGSQHKQHKSAGQIIVESKEFKAIDLDKRGSHYFSLKSITNSDETSAGALLQPDQLGLIEAPQRKLVILDLLARGSMSTQQIHYPREKGFTNAAKIVDEGSAKPESSIEIEQITESAKVIAHWMDVSRQALSDTSYLQSYIDTRLRYGLALKKEDAILNGKGGGSDFDGLLKNAIEFDAKTNKALATSKIDALRLAALQVTIAEYSANGFVLNPFDWAAIELEKDTIGRYIIGNPTGALSPTLWGLSVVESSSMAVDSFLTGAFNLAAQYFDRWAASVEISLESGDNFKNNMATILAEERGALAIFRPEALVKGTFAKAVVPPASKE